MEPVSVPRQGVRTLTPNHVVYIARAVLVVLLGLIAMTMAAQPYVTAILCYFATVSLFVACPRIRAGDLAASVLVMLLLLCFLEGAQTGTLSVTRFSLAMAAAGAAVLPFKLSRIRRLSGHNGYRTLADYQVHERRRRSDVAQSSPVPVERPPVLLIGDQSHKVSW